MNETTKNKHKNPTMIVRKCHVCGQVHESSIEIQKCVKCNKSFLPLNYFEKVHNTKQADYSTIFAESHELDEQDIIKGIFVLW